MYNKPVSKKGPSLGRQALIQDQISTSPSPRAVDPQRSRCTDIITYIIYNLKGNYTVFEIALIRDKWLFTRTSKQSVSSYPSDKWKFSTIQTICRYHFIIM